MTCRRHIFLPLLLILIVAPPFVRAQKWPEDARSLAPFVPSPQEVVDRMLQLANVRKGDMVYDLGCGDGRIIITAAQKFGAQATGIELDDDLYKHTAERVHKMGLDDRVKVVHGNALETDLSPATVVTLYLLTASNTRLKPNLEKYLKPGSRVVSHDFQVIGWKPVKVEKLNRDQREHTIYLYEIGKNK
jgi:predicted RNA methylase